MTSFVTPGNLDGSVGRLFCSSSTGLATAFITDSQPKRAPEPSKSPGPPELAVES